MVPGGPDPPVKELALGPGGDRRLGPGERPPDRLFDPRRDGVGFLYRHRRRHHQVELDEGPGTGPAGSKVMDLERPRHRALDRRFDLGSNARLQRLVQQPSHRTPHDAKAKPKHMGGHEEGEERIKPDRSSAPGEQQSGHDPERGGGLGDEVQPVGLERPPPPEEKSPQTPLGSAARARKKSPAGGAESGTGSAKRGKTERKIAPAARTTKTPSITAQWRSSGGRAAYPTATAIPSAAGLESDASASEYTATEPVTP